MADFATDSHDFDALLAGEPIVTYSRTLQGGNGTLARGSVLAEDSDDGDKLVLVDSGSATTSIQEPKFILAEETDTSDGDIDAAVYAAGQFNENELTFGGDDGPDDHRDALRGLNIYLKDAVQN
ncbi:MAG: head decoration protein [Thiohalospira sp.]